MDDLERLKDEIERLKFAKELFKAGKTNLASRLVAIIVERLGTILFK